MEARSRQVEVEGASVHFREGGKGPPVLLVHGWIESSWCWLPLFERLGDRYRLHALDLLGYGQTVAPVGAEDSDIEVNTVLVERFLERQIGESVHLVGHSMGGMISLGIATRRPELVRSITLISTPIDGQNAVAPLLQLVGLPVIRGSAYRLIRSKGVARLLSTYFVHRMEVPEQMIEDAQRVTPEAMLGSARSILETDMAALLARVRAPALVVFGDRDRIVNIGQGALAADRLRHADFRMLKNCGHCPQVEQPWELALALQEFFHEADGIPPRWQGATF